MHTKKINSYLYIIFNKPSQNRWGMIFQVIIFINIFISITILFLETEPSLHSYLDIFNRINTINMIIFTIEYLLRIYSSTVVVKKSDRIKYCFSPLMLIDLLAILPFYLSFMHLDLSFLRALRVLRIFKIFRLAKFSQIDNLFLSILKENKEELIFTVVIIFALLFTITPLVYYCEKDVQPLVFTSMGKTLWWAITTFTTVGYGDMYPISTGGRILTTIVSFLGIAFYAIPGSIFTSALLDKLNKKKQNKRQ